MTYKSDRGHGGARSHPGQPTRPLAQGSARHLAETPRLRRHYVATPTAVSRVLTFAVEKMVVGEGRGMELVFKSSAPRLFQTMPAHGPGSARPPGVRGISATKVRGSRAGRAIGRASARQASNKRDHDRGASISRSAFEARALAAHFRERARAHQHRIAIDKNVAAPSRALESSRFAMRSTSSRPFRASNPTLCSRSEPSWMTSEAFARRPDQGRPVEHGEHGHLRRARPPLSRRSRHFDQEGPSYLGIPHGLMSQVLTFNDERIAIGDGRVAESANLMV